jgi:methyl-accepting chemotaxis protein
MSFADPFVWIAAVLAVVVVFLSIALRRQRAAHAGLEASRRDSFERTATELASAAKGLLGNVSSVTSTSAEAVDHVRATTETMTQLSHTAMTAAVSAETVIGLAHQSERAADEALAVAEERGEELSRLADDVRAMAERIGRLNVAMRDVFEAAAMVGFVAERSQKVAQSAGADGGGSQGVERIAEEMRRHADDARRAAQQVRAVLAEVQRAMTAAMSAAEAGERRATGGAELVRKTRKTIRDLAAALRESAGAAKHIAKVAQQQGAKFDEVLGAMNGIYLATEKSLQSTEQVAREARSLDELATSLRRAVGG